MLLDRVSNPGPLTYESGALPIALRTPANCLGVPLSEVFNTAPCEKGSACLNIFFLSIQTIIPN